MRRNSTILFLESPGAITPLPWDNINQRPIWDGFTGISLSVLQQAWQTFLDSGQPLEIIPDPNPIPVTVIPNWNSFYDGLMISQTYNFLLAQTVPHPSISGVMAAMGIALLKGESDPLNPDRLAALQASVSAILYALNAVGITLSTEQLTEIRTLLDGNGFDSIQLE